jgi:hypothetical protein
MSCVSVGGQHPTPFAPGTQFCLTHQSSYPFAGDASPPVFEVTMDAWTPISALVGNKDLPNLLREESIFSLALAGRTLAPGIKAAFRDSKHVAHPHNGKFVLVLFDKPIFHLDSREKMLTAFLVYHAPAGLALIPV